jgi:hypothetical protein
MLIIGAALINRFSISNGWTREKVAQLLIDKDINHVTPRYFKPNESDPDDYFAVYDDAIFDLNEVEKHEFRPFSQHECDNSFNKKNRCTRPTNE